MTVAKISPPWKGLDQLGQYPDAGYGDTALNVLPGRQDCLIARGGISAVITGTTNWATPATTGYPYEGAGSWVVGDRVLVATTSNDFDEINVATGAVVHRTPAMPSNGLSRSFAVGDSVAYGPGLVNGGSAYLYRWSPGSTPTTIADAPWNAQAVCFHLGRLFCLGGSPPGTNSAVGARNNVLYWTDPLVNSAGATLDSQLSPGTINAWKDDVSGLVNQIVLPAGDQYLGVVSINRSLYVLGRRTILVLSGTAPSAFTVTRAVDTGLHADGHAYCAVDSGMYFMASDGLRYYDGASLRNVSWPRVTFNVGDPTISLCPMPGGYVSVTGASTWRMLQTASGYWSDFSSTLLTGGVPTIVRAAQSATLALDMPTHKAYDVSLTTMDHSSPWAALGLTELADDTKPFTVQASTQVPLATPLQKTTLQRAHAQGRLTALAGSYTRLRLTADGATAGIGGTTYDVTLPGTAASRLAFADADVRSETETLRASWSYVPVGNLHDTDTALAWYPAYIEHQAAQSR